MRNLLYRDAAESQGSVHLFSVGETTYGNFVVAAALQGAPAVCAWRTRGQAVGDEGLDFMACAVERTIAGGSGSFEITLDRSARVPNRRVAASAIRAALIGVDGRLVTVSPGEDGSGRDRFTVDWLPPAAPRFEKAIAKALGAPQAAVTVTATPESASRFGLHAFTRPVR